MLNRILLIMLALIAVSQSAGAQIFYDENHPKFQEEQIRKEFDESTHFTLYKDNYFTAGIPIGDKINSENSDVKFQISVSQRLTKSTLPFHSYLYLFYSQKCMWNVFQESLPMRDLNFNPGLGWSKLLIVKGKLVGSATLLIEHESNGRDSLASRSWNKISLCANIYVTNNLMVHGKAWIPIVDGENNKDILKYSGIYQGGIQYRTERWGFAATLVKRKGWNLNCNTILEANYRIFKNENQYFFLQYYNGYGENLLDYNRFHSRLRAGIVIKPNFFSEY